MMKLNYARNNANWKQLDSQFLRAKEEFKMTTKKAAIEVDLASDEKNAQTDNNVILTEVVVDEVTQQYTRTPIEKIVAAPRADTIVKSNTHVELQPEDCSLKEAPSVDYQQLLKTKTHVELQPKDCSLKEAPSSDYQQLLKTKTHVELQPEDCSLKEAPSSDYQQLLKTKTALHIMEKTRLRNLLSASLQYLSDAECKLIKIEERLANEIKLRKQETLEWEKIKSDLLVCVKVADDFRNEAEADAKAERSTAQQLLHENINLKLEIQLLIEDIAKFTQNEESTSSTSDDVPKMQEYFQLQL